MITIYKYILTFTGRIGEAEVALPQGAEILHFDVRAGHFTVWARIDTARDLVKRRFLVAGTGWEWSQTDREAKHIASIITPEDYVWHLFDVGEFEVEKST